jgi:hypothetical protein
LLARTLRIVISVGFAAGAAAIVLSRTDLSAVGATAAELSPTALAVVAVTLFAGALLASLRIGMIARDLGYPLSLRDAVAVLSVGQLAGGLFFQLVGQLIARGALLARRGLPVAVTLVLTGYERVVALAVSLALALAGGWLIFGRVALDMQSGGMAFIEIAIGLVLAVLAGAALGWGRKAIRGVAPHVSGALIGRASRSVAISVAIQLCTMAAYVAAAHSLSPEIPIADLSAAAAVVMLAASMPISLAGWGVREVSAVLALGAIGMPPEKALVVALLVGVGALAVVALLALISVGAWRRAGVPAETCEPTRTAFDYGAALVWALPLATATAVFFQVHVPTGEGGWLNLNFADPAAIMGGILFVIWALRDRRWPAWRLSHFNAHVFAATGVFVLAFLIGWSAIGWTSWAFTNKLLGWLVLLSYGATGALLVSRMGEEGFNILMRTLAAVAAAIAAIDIVEMAARMSGFDVPVELLYYRAQGFTLNSNAFAFQLVLAAIAALVGFHRMRNIVVILSLILVGLWFGGSRAALGTATVVMILVLIARGRLLRPLAAAGVIAIAATAVIANMPLLIETAMQAVATAKQFLGTALWDGFGIPTAGDPTPAQVLPYGIFAGSAEESDTERLASLRGAWELFAGHPVFGAGLGVFIERHLRETGVMLVIHSTPLWLLAEFGLVGTLVIASPLIRTFLRELRPAFRRDDTALVLVFIITAFAVMSLAHEMMYQRLFWLMLGAALAAVPASGAARTGNQAR